MHFHGVNRFVQIVPDDCVLRLWVDARALLAEIDLYVIDTPGDQSVAVLLFMVVQPRHGLGAGLVRKVGVNSHLEPFGVDGIHQRLHASRKIRMACDKAAM